MINVFIYLSWILLLCMSLCSFYCKQCWFYGLTAAGWYYLWYFLFTHFGWIICHWRCSAALGCVLQHVEVIGIIENILAVILLPCTTSMGSRGHPRTEVAFRICLASLFLWAAVIVFSLEITEWKRADDKIERRSYEVDPTLQRTCLLSKLSLLWSLL